MATRRKPKESFYRITVAEAKEKLAAGAAIVDIRPPGDWAGGHVPGAQNLPLVSVRGRAREIAPDVDVIFVDQKGEKSPQAAETAHSLEFKKVFIIEGGLDAWIKEGNELETIH